MAESLSNIEVRVPPLTLTPDSADLAFKYYGFNCGPAAVCAVTGVTPWQLKPHLGDFEFRRYTNPSLMWEILGSLGLKFRATVTPKQYEYHLTDTSLPLAHHGKWWSWPRFGLARVQWGGPWARAGVPARVRYRKTHWVGCDDDPRGLRIFDINALHLGGWVPLGQWSAQVVPFVLSGCVPDGDGSWWLTHSVEVRP